MKRTLLSLLGLTLFTTVAFGQMDGSAKSPSTNADPAALSASVAEAAPLLTEAAKLALENAPVVDAPEADVPVEEQKIRPSAPNGTAVTVTATAGTMGPTDYATLKLAFDAINLGTHQGDITIAINANTTETASAVLNSGAVGPAAYTSVSIAPVGGARTITGSIVGAVIKLNGADNVTIDGRIAGTGRNLTVSNTSTATATAAIWLASVAAGNGASNNVIRNLEIAAGTDSSAAGTNASFGIAMCGITIGVSVNGVDNDNNSFIANRIIKARYGIMTRGTITDLNVAPIVTDNIVGPSSFGTDQIGKVGIFMQADTGATVSRNIVQNVGCLEPQACTGADRMGIAIGNESWSMAPATLTSNTYTVTNNVIHDVIEEITFSAMGINLATTGGGTATSNLVANNFIYNVRANGTAGDQAVGLGIAGGHTDTVAFNSISMTGDVDPGASTASSMFGSGIRVANANGTTHLDLTLKNNSVYMDLSSSSGPTVRYYAISGNTSAYSFGTGGEDNNNLYINPANTQLQTGGLGTASGVTLTNQFATLANWQAAYTAPQDAASIQANPVYSSPTGDLHLVGTSPNINAAVAIAGVTTDIDLEARPNGANPDIGADEYYALPGNLQFSSVTYSGNEGTSPTITVTRSGGNAGTVTVDVTLTDVSATGGAACGVGVDYVNPGVQTLTFIDGVPSQTFPVALCTDLVVDVNETFALTLSNPTGGAGIGANNPATMTIGDLPPPLSGSYNVPGDYASLTNAGGIFAALNVSGASGNITINITADLIGETGANGLNGLAGGFTVLIRPTGAARSITGSATGALIKFVGASNVTVDGALATNDRSLTIENTSVTTPSVLTFSSVGTTPITNNTLRNCVIRNGATTSSAVVTSDSATLGNPGFFSNITIQNNRVEKAFIGVYSNGGTAPQGGSNLMYLDNDLTATGTNAIRLVGLYMQGVNGALVSGNDIGNFSGTEAETDRAIWMASGTINARADANKIFSLKYTGTGGFAGQGIAISTGVTSAGIILSNNMIYDLSGDGNAYTGANFGRNPFGIYAFGAQTGVSIDFNSINLSGNTLNLTDAISAGIALGTGTTANIRNNNIVNNLGRLGAVGYGSVGTILQSAASQMAVGDFNDLFVSPTGSGVIAIGQIATTASPTLAGWRTATSQEANSLSVDPGYLSATDLHITNASPVANLGTPVAGITTDFDFETRNATTPDIGADEVSAAAPLTASSAVSRKTHGGEGDFDIDLPFVAPFGIECRSGGGSNDYTVVITFSNDVVSGSAAVTTGTGAVSGSPGFAANTMTINLTGVTDVQQIAVTATNVTDVFAQVLPSTEVPMKVLIGDTNASSSVSGTDVAQTKSQSGNAADGTNFRSDVVAGGAINGTDVAIVKSKSGNGLP